MGTDCPPDLKGEEEPGGGELDYGRNKKVKKVRRTMRMKNGL